MRCITRRPDALARAACASTKIVAGDALVPRSLEAALAGVKVAYYLIHSMGTSGDFEDLDRRAATNFAAAARAAGLEQIVYLGGLGSGGASRRTSRAARRWATSCAARE